MMSGQSKFTQRQSTAFSFLGNATVLTEAATEAETSSLFVKLTLLTLFCITGDIH